MLILTYFPALMHLEALKVEGKYRLQSQSNLDLHPDYPTDQLGDFSQAPLPY